MLNNPRAAVERCGSVGGYLLNSVGLKKTGQESRDRFAAVTFSLLALHGETELRGIPGTRRSPLTTQGPSRALGRSSKKARPWGSRGTEIVQEYS